VKRKTPGWPPGEYFNQPATIRVADGQAKYKPTAAIRQDSEGAAMNMHLDAATVARIMGGDVVGRDQVNVPGPGHSAKDRSLSIKLDPNSRDGFVVNSFAGGDDPIACKDYVRERLSLGRFEPKVKAGFTRSNEPVDFNNARTTGFTRQAEAKLKCEPADYIYQRQDGSPYLKVHRTADKDFVQYHREGTKWILGAPAGPKIPYRLPELLSAEHNEVYICEGEKDADNVLKLGFLATTNSGGSNGWTTNLNSYFRGRNVTIIPDNDAAGDKWYTQVANGLRGIAAEIRILKQPDLSHKGDVSDWIKAGGDADKLTAFKDAAAVTVDVMSVPPRSEDAELPSKLPPNVLKLSYFEDFDKQAPTRPVLKNLFNLGETSAIIGPPGSGKSALEAEMVVAIVTGNDWRGHTNKLACGVVIFALERADLYKRRFKAYALRDEHETLNVAVVGAVIDLLNPNVTDAIVATVKEAEKHLGINIGMIVIDTFSKGIAANGGDEDKAKDQNRAAANLRRVQELIDVHIALVGHTGKDETRGARGSNAHVGDVDVMCQISGDSTIKTAKIIKANDQAERVIAQFRLDVIEIGIDDDGEAITTAIVSSEEVSGSCDTGKAKLSAMPAAALRVLWECVADGPQAEKPNNVHVPIAATGVLLATWKNRLRVAGIISPEKHGNTQFDRVRVALINAMKIGVWEDFVWPAT
jgi:5S rRNA maturation endonuclease (ribonuclease M5)